MSASMPRLMICSSASGMGKTTLTCGLIQALKNRGLAVSACKCGPDFIDPMFHREVLGASSCNLDLFLAGEGFVRNLVGRMAHQAQVTIIEGAMGYYDGIAQSSVSSAYDVARVTKTPAVLVVDGRGRALSVCAEVCGFRDFRTPSQVAGIILNQVSPGYAATMAKMVEHECGLPVLGYVPRLDEAVLESRHLGLVSAAEVAGLRAKVDAVACALEQTVDLDRLLQLAGTAPGLVPEPCELPAPVAGEPLVAVAEDEAFNFYYPETLDLLEQLGARLVRFSPLHDGQLPEGTCGLYLGGGYPELHARELSANESLRRQIAELVAGGLPTIAECGGFLYLHETMVDAEGLTYPMVGAVPGHAYGRDRLGRFGYVTLTSAHDSLLAGAGEQLPAHEFHYWESSNPGTSFCARKPQSTRSWDCVVATESLYAGFPHLYLAAHPCTALRFVRACAAFDQARGGVCKSCRI